MVTPFMIFRFIVVPCLMKNVEACATQSPNVKVVSQMGIMFRTSFSSSIFVTVTSLHGL